MKKGQVYEATVERVDFPCKGIASTQEGPVTVKNSLPGQKIKLIVSKVRNGKAEGRLPFFSSSFFPSSSFSLAISIKFSSLFIRLPPSRQIDCPLFSIAQNLS